MITNVNVFSKKVAFRRGSLSRPRRQYPKFKKHTRKGVRNHA